MEIRKSQRLSQYLSLISDMVHYRDIGTHMNDYGVLSNNEHALLQSKLDTEGNVSAMNEFLTIINLRPMGFDNFVQVLKKTDYEWVARQLDPGAVLTDSSSTFSGEEGKSARVQSLLANVRQKMSRKNEQVIPESGKINDDEITHMSYRDSCPIEIPFNPECDMEVHPNEDCRQTQYTTATTASDSSSEMPKNDVAVQLESLELGSSKSQSNENIALVENVPGSLNGDSTEKYFEKLAKRLDAPVPADLKIIKHGKILKHGTKGRMNKVKLEFHSEDARNHFIQTFKEFIGNLKPKDELYDTAAQLNISIPKPTVTTHSCKGFFRRKWRSNKSSLSSSASSSRTSSMNVVHSEKQSSRKHWYQRRFCVKTWKPKKD